MVFISFFTRARLLPRIVGSIATVAAFYPPAANAQPPPQYSANVIRTTYGIPHISARDYAGLGYGVGYTAGEDAVCILAEQRITVRGERSLYFGEGPVAPWEAATNLESDVYYRVTGDLEKIRRAFASQSSDVQALVRGFTAGYNRYLRDNAGRLPAPCAGQPWMQPMSVEDALLIVQSSTVPRTHLQQVAAAAPPGTKSAAVGLPILDAAAIGPGSNGWAFGADATANGRGLLIGNPHYPWEGPNRFRQMHLTIPGKLDVMGAGLITFPLVVVGFNSDVAWTHTITPARHWTLFELQLDQNDPTAYIVDGRKEPMARRTLTIPVKDREPVTRTVYSSRYGPMIAAQNSGLGWTSQRAYAVRDANFHNLRSFEAWLGLGRARNVRDVRNIIGRTLGVSIATTIAADRHGDALYADVTPVPNVTAAKLNSCSAEIGRSALFRERHIFILDGSRGDCDWDKDASTPSPGLMPERLLPTLVRRDFVQNSNDSYWLTNPASPLSGASPLLGPENQRPSFRTQSGLTEIRNQLATGPMTRETAGALILANKSMTAERILDDLVASCEGDPALGNACAALRGWNRRADLDSRGALLFFSFLDKARQLGNWHRVPFDPSDPLNSPRGLSAEAADDVRKALQVAVSELTKAGVPLDAPLGSVQGIWHGSERIPIHGGPPAAGILNFMESRPTPRGLLPSYGSSYIQLVSFERSGPIVDAILAHSQSVDPKSPHSADQTRLFSKKEWHRLPFNRAEIKASAIGPELRLVE